MAEKLTNDEIAAIKTDAAENWDGDLRLAVAAHVHGAGVVLKVGRRVPPFADKRQIADLKRQIIVSEKAKK